MPIIHITPESGSPTCPTGKVLKSPKDCTLSNAGYVPATVVCGTCNEDALDCGCIVSSVPEARNTDACCVNLGCTTSAPSTACNESFRGTTRACEGHILTKAHPADKCLQHLHTERDLFIINTPTGGIQTSQPEVAVPAANGYQVTSSGKLIKDSKGDPILADAPAFTKLWVSGVTDEAEDKLFVVNAPNSTDKLNLVAQDGCFQLVSQTEQQLCAKILPEQVTTGRLLVLDRVADCDGEEWCVKELDPGSPLDACVQLTGVTDANGNFNVGFITPPTTAGFLRTDPAMPCTPVNGDTLSTAELAQFKGFLDQMFCEPTVDGTATIDRLMVCASRVGGTTNAEGSQPVTLAELASELDRIRVEDPDANMEPLDEDGDPLVDGLPYVAIYNSTARSFVYRLQGFSRIVGPTRIATFQGVNANSSATQTSAVSIPGAGVVLTIENYAKVRVRLDIRGRSSSTSAELFLNFVVGGQEIGWVGAKNLVQATFSTGNDVVSSENSFDALLPIIAGNVSFTINFGYAGSNPQNEYYGDVSLIGAEYVPF